MARVMIVSRNFPKHHKRAGESTMFVEKIWESLGYPKRITMNGLEQEFYNWNKVKHQYMMKHHTIMSGFSRKVGEKISLRIWSGKPYRSKQITIYDDIEIKKIYNIEIMTTEDGVFFVINNVIRNINTISNNDGLNYKDLLSWFVDDPKYNLYFSGQIICWNEIVDYSSLEVLNYESGSVNEKS